MNLHAPIVNLEEFGLNNMLLALKTECENITYLPGRSFKFQVQFSMNEDFNAVAYEIDDTAYTNVSIATVMQLYHHVLLLMGRGELLIQGGYEEPFEGNYRIEEFQEPEICQYDSQYKQIAFYIGPDNLKRRHMAELITLFGMEFLMFHEVGHHVGGHLRFLSEELGIQELYAQKNSVVVDAKVYQMLETDADAIAIASLLESISTKIDFYRNEYLDKMGNLIPHCVIIAVTTVFFLMQREDYSYKIADANYLPRDIRFQLVVNILMDKLKSDYKMCAFSQTQEQLMKTFEICNSLLGELYVNKDPEKKILFCEKDNIREYYNKTLIPLWKDIRKELKLYAVIHLPE